MPSTPERNGVDLDKNLLSDKGEKSKGWRERNKRIRPDNPPL